MAPHDRPQGAPVGLTEHIFHVKEGNRESEPSGMGGKSEPGLK